MTISEYHRPDSLEQAYQLLGRKEPVFIPMGGGTGIHKQEKESMAVIDLQNLGLNKIEKDGSFIQVGATATLDALENSPFMPDALIRAIRLETPFNQRQVATLAGKLVTATGASPLATLLMALGATLTWGPGEIKVSLGEWLSLRQAVKDGKSQNPGLLITQISWDANSEALFDTVGRSPDDQPIVCVGACGWSTGRRRIVLGGYGTAPRLVVDGPDEAGIIEAAQSAYSQCGDEWASAAYRQELAGTLTSRALKSLSDYFV